eukprot:COSAG05_NODE_737_length_7636_cov_48.020433_3_plen_76_part_00
MRKAIGGRHPVPRKSLIGFERTSLRAEERVSLPFTFDQKAIMLVNEQGKQTLYQGQRTLIFSNGAGGGNNISITV